MTPHTKAATIIAPFLLIGGYIAADFYASTKEEKIHTTEAKSTTAYGLTLSSKCRMPDEPCILRKDQLVITVSADAKYYYLESNMKLEGVTLGLAQIDRVTRGLEMQRVSDSSHWIAKIRTLSNLKEETPLLMRIALGSDKKRYYAEFPITHSGPWGAK